MLNIDSIQNGIVIDHIKAGKGMRIYELLELDKLDCCVALIKNARSSKLGRKDIIKIEGDIHINFDVLGFIDNHITVCTIRDGALVITTYGYGDGLGLSQYGAYLLAQSGQTYKDILLHYYRSVEISEI